MPNLRRTVAVLCVGVIILACPACKSNNEGKIVGKWKSTSPFEGAAAGSVFIEFTSGGMLTMSLQSTPILTARYKLSTGDFIVLSDVKLMVPTNDKTDRGGRIKVTIKGDAMTWVEKGSTLQLTRAN